MEARRMRVCRLKGMEKKKISDDDDATSCRLMLFVH